MGRIGAFFPLDHMASWVKESSRVRKLPGKKQVSSRENKETRKSISSSFLQKKWKKLEETNVVVRRVNVGKKFPATVK